MRKNVKNAPVNPSIAAKYVKVNARKPRKTGRRLMWASNVLLMLGVLALFVPSVIRQYKLEADAKAFILGIANGYNAAVAEDERAFAEAETMKEHHALRTTIYCEAPRLVGNKLEDVAAEMLHLADAIFSRVDSPNYPDTVQAVVTEERTDRKTGKLVAMFSPFHTECFNSPKNETAGERIKWKLAGKMASIAFRERWDGKKSSGNTHFLMDYVDPAWKTVDVKNCRLKAKGSLAGFHLYFAEVLPKDREACLAGRQLNVATVTLPEVGPLPVWNPKRKQPRPAPAQDDVASLILASN